MLEEGVWRSFCKPFLVQYAPLAPFLGSSMDPPRKHSGPLAACRASVPTGLEFGRGTRSWRARHPPGVADLPQQRQLLNADRKTLDTTLPDGATDIIPRKQILFLERGSSVKIVRRRFRAEVEELAFRLGLRLQMPYCPHCTADRGQLGHRTNPFPGIV